MSWFYEQYLPGGTAATPTTATPTPTASPPAAPTATGPTASAAEADLARADLAGVAPAIVATAEFDPLRDEGAAYAARLADAGVPTQYVPGPGLIHGFAGFLGVVDAADAAVADVLARLRQLLHG
jgi:acetyl esterase